MIYLQDPDVTSCVEWHGYRNRGGYGCVNRRNRGGVALAHRVVWEECFGAIPAGAQIHHDCENPGCINPAHLRLCPTDKAHKQRHAARRTHCRRGHPYAETARYHRDGSGRYCRTCERENERARSAAVSI